MSDATIKIDTKELEAVLAPLIETLKNTEARLYRLESMIAYTMGNTPREVTTTPNKVQAQQLHALGLPAWPRITRKTNDYELWLEGFNARMKKMAEANEAPAEDAAPKTDEESKP